MINKFEITDVIEIHTISDIENRPNYKFDINPTTTNLEEVIWGYDLQKEEIHCGLTNCHQPHHIGYLVKTADGHETNIGTFCGVKHFGKDFNVMKNKFNAERKIQKYRKKLNEVIYYHDDIFYRIKTIKENGGTKLHKSINNFIRTYPDNVISTIRSRARRKDDIISTTRERTVEEFNAAILAADVDPTKPNVNTQKYKYISEYSGRIQGLHIFTRSIRDVIINELEIPLGELLELDNEASMHKLYSWYQWAESIDELFMEAEILIEEGRKFFNKDNLALIHKHIASDHDKNMIAEINSNIKKNKSDNWLVN